MDNIGSLVGILEPYLSVQRVGEVAVLRFTDDIVFVALDLESKNALWRLLDAASASEDVGAVVLLGSATCFAPRQVKRFWRHVLHHDDPTAAPPTAHAARGDMDLHREGTGHQQFAAKVRACHKAVVAALQGEVCSPFLGDSLACDYRVVADDTVFRNLTRELGVPPGGALARLLPAYVGYGRASELLLGSRDITAAEALELGLVNAVVPAANLEAAALDAARRFAAMPAHALAAIKRLLSDSLHGLDEHFQLENQLIDSCLPNVRPEALWSEE